MAEGIDTVRWTVYGKINRIVKNSTSTGINFGYDSDGNRTLKQVINHDTTNNTYYVRDAQGVVLAVYSYSSLNSSLKWAEQHLYGSSRLGIWKWDIIVPGSPPIAQLNNPIYDTILFGQRNYELTNHLQNVLVTISDKKLGVDENTDGTIDYSMADVASAQDYYPFGMLQPGRQYGSLGRYGFNGKEQDPEVKRSGAQYDYGFRIYDPKIGKFLSVDPLAKSFPWNSPFSYAEGDGD